MKIVIVRCAVLFVLMTAVWMLGSASRAVAASCSVTSASMAFGSYNVYGADLAASGVIDMTCSAGGSPRPMATLSAGDSGTITDRYMRCSSGVCLTNGFSGDELHYNLYTSTAHTVDWGTTPIPSAPSNCGNMTCVWTIFGMIPAAIGHGINDVSAGGYTDTITITISY